MTLYRYQGQERDQNGKIVPGAKITILEYDGGTVATLYDDNGNSLPNPVTSNSYGVYYFNVTVPDAYWQQHYYDGQLRVEDWALVSISLSTRFQGPPGSAGAPGAGINTPPGLTGNGVANDGATIAAYSAALPTGSEFWLPKGIYRFTANATINSLIRFMKGAIIKPDAGVTVTIADVDCDPIAQIFDVSAALSYAWANNGRVTQFSYGALGRGGDDTAPFQHLIDNQLYHQVADVYPYGGKFKITKPLIFNYGGGFRSISWHGPSSGYNADASRFSGLTLDTSSFYECAFEIQGARAMVISGTEFIGPFVGMFNTTLFGSGAPVTADPYDRTKWIPTGASPLCLSRYKMCAAVHVDPRCGNKPTAAAWAVSTPYTYGTSVTNGGNLYVCYATGTSASSGGPSGTGSGSITDGTCVWKYAGAASTSIAYSDRTDPPWAGSVDQYNKPLSSNIKVEGCWIHGYGAGLAVKGCDADGNADFVRAETTQFNMNVYDFTWGHSQARLQGANDCIFTEAYSHFSNAIIGRQGGQAHISARNSQVGNSLYVYDFPNSSIGGGVVLDACYGEVCNIIGVCRSSGPSGSGTNITGGNFSFAHDQWGRIPPFVIDTTNVELAISGASLSNLFCPLVIQGDPNMCAIRADIPNAAWMTGDSNPAAITIGQAIMRRSTSDVMFANQGAAGGTGAQGPWTGSIRNSSQYSITTGGTRQFVPCGPHARTDLTTPIAFCSTTAAHSMSDTTDSQPVSLGGVGWLFSPGNITSVAYSGRTLTMVLNASPSISNAVNRGVDKGGIIYHIDTNNLFVVEVRSGATLTLTQLNNLAYNATIGNSTPIIPTTNVGSFYAVPTGHYMPASAYRLTWTSGSAGVTVTYNDGTNVGSALDFPVGAVKATSDEGTDLSTIARANSAVTGVVDGTITMAGNANRTSVTGTRIWLVPR